jgi:hypothetical protein
MFAAVHYITVRQFHKLSVSLFITSFNTPLRSTSSAVNRMNSFYCYVFHPVAHKLYQARQEEYSVKRNTEDNSLRVETCRPVVIFK